MTTPSENPHTSVHGPCAVCGKDGEQEPRFLYFVCKEHENTPPVQPQRYVLTRFLDSGILKLESAAAAALDSLARGDNGAGPETRSRPVFKPCKGK